MDTQLPPPTVPVAGVAVDYDAYQDALPPIFSFVLGGETFEVADVDPDLLVNYLQLLQSQADVNSAEAWNTVKGFLVAAVRPGSGDALEAAFARRRPGIQLVMKMIVDLVEATSKRPTAPLSS